MISGAMATHLEIPPSEVGVLADGRQDEDKAVLALIRAAAEETLAIWPEARAAVLFGSRARGDHHCPDGETGAVSDWDVAFITAGDGAWVEDIPEGLPIRALEREFDVQSLALSAGLARRKARAIGHVAMGIDRDGLLLAGAWRPCGYEGEEPAMDPAEYWALVSSTLGRMREAVVAADDLGKAGGWGRDLTACDTFAARSADMAEYLSKAMLGRHGVSYPHKHDLEVLAQEARKKHFDALADAVLSMNGETKRHHAATYGGRVGVTAAGCRHAVGRFLATVPLLAKELAASNADARLAAGKNGRLPVEMATSLARE